MIFIFIASMLAFYVAMQSATSRNRRTNIIFVSLVFNLAFIFFEQLYLEHELLRSFHFSDPSNYYEEVRKLSFQNLLDFVGSDEYKSNQFYYIINWIYESWTPNSTIVAVMLKLTNCMLFYTAFILATNNEIKNDAIDAAILLHPYLTMLLIRNVRDAYIIFFLVLFVCLIQGERLKGGLKWACIISTIGFMAIIRPFFTGIMGIIALNNGVPKKIKKIIIFPLFIGSMIFVYINFSEITTKLFSAVFSTFSVHEGFDEERNSIVTDLIEGNGAGFGFWLSTVKRIGVGVPVFLFTPNPISYTIKYAKENINGIWGIYTELDNIIIIIGAVINYLFVYPILMREFVAAEKINKVYLFIAIFMGISYIIFQLGITDTRIKYTFLFFALLSIRGKKPRFGLNEIQNIKYLAASIALMIGLSLV